MSKEETAKELSLLWLKLEKGRSIQAWQQVFAD